jgi:hypothetical protein
VIQKAVLQRGYGHLPYWITPHPYGSVYDSSVPPKGEWLPSEMLDGINDGLLTDSIVPKNGWIYQEFTFGIDADEMGISDPLKLVLLKIVYQSHDHSLNNLTLSINDGVPNEWKLIDSEMEEYKNVVACDKEGLTVYNITSNVTTTAELENLKVKFEATGNAANQSEKVGWVDFVGVHVEY